jgi:uncharacterized LabA/DUF88 family protein
MLSEGRKPRAENVVIGEAFAWTNRIFLAENWNIRRVSYYTSLCGDDDAVTNLRRAISTTTYNCDLGEMRRSGQLIPFVRKKSAKSKKESICDIAIAVDVMRACYRDHASNIWILSGDGDFVQLFNEVVHSGKQIYAAAFSSGLNEEIPLVVDEFICLDDLFFEPVPAPAPAESEAVSANGTEP